MTMHHYLYTAQNFEFSLSPRKQCHSCCFKLQLRATHVTQATHATCATNYPLQQTEKQHRRFSKKNGILYKGCNACCIDMKAAVPFDNVWVLQAAAAKLLEQKNVTIKQKLHQLNAASII